MLHEALPISYEATSIIIIVPSYGQSQPLQFAMQIFYFMHLMYIVGKASHILQQQEVSYKALLSVSSQMSFTFPPHKLFFLKNIYQHGSFVKTYLANYGTYEKAPMCYRYFSTIYYKLIADIINSQKSEDCNITDKLLEMMLATTKLQQMQT
jgi:hypothetical protein